MAASSRENREKSEEPERITTITEETATEKQAKERKKTSVTSGLHALLDIAPKNRSADEASPWPSDQSELQQDTPEATLERLKVLETENKRLKHENKMQNDNLQYKNNALKKVINRLELEMEDKLSVARNTAAETQLRQLVDLQTVTDENRQLAQKLSDLIDGIRQQQQQQQLPTPGNMEEHKHGTYFSIMMLTGYF